MIALVVEDDPTSKKLVHHVLERDGFEVISVPGAPDVLACIGHTVPDVILIDLSLPGVDGVALASQLNADSRVRDVPLVAVTAFPERFPRSRIMEMGFRAYLVKPIDTRSLSAVIRNVVQPEG